MSTETTKEEFLKVSYNYLKSFLSEDTKRGSIRAVRPRIFYSRNAIEIQILGDYIGNIAEVKEVYWIQLDSKQSIGKFMLYKIFNQKGQSSPFMVWESQKERIAQSKRFKTAVEAYQFLMSYRKF